MEHSDEKWTIIESVIPPDKKGSRGQDRPSAHSPRFLFGAITFKLCSGCRRKDLPPCFPLCQKVQRIFQKWREKGLFHNIAKALGEQLFLLGKLKPQEAFIDGTFAPSKKGGG